MKSTQVFDSPTTQNEPVFDPDEDILEAAFEEYLRYVDTLKNRVPLRKTYSSKRARNARKKVLNGIRSL